MIATVFLGASEAHSSDLTLASTRSSQLARVASVLRNAEKVFGETAVEMWLAATIVATFSPKAASLIGVGAATASYEATQAGKKASEVEKQAEAEKADEAAHSDPLSPSPSTNAPSVSFPKSRSTDGPEDRGRAFRSEDGRTYGGRASEYRPEWHDAISKAC